MINVDFIKVHKDAKLPTYNHFEEDTGLDVYSVENILIPARGCNTINIGLKLGYITPGYWFKIETRSGMGFKASLLTHPGIIDFGYRGSLDVKIYNFSDKDYKVKKGDKVAQLVFYELIKAVPGFINSPIISERGEEGFGSSDEEK